MRVAFLQALRVGKREQRREKAVQEQLCSGHCLGEHGHQLGHRGCKDFGGGIGPRGESDQGESDEGASPGPSQEASRSRAEPSPKRGLFREIKLHSDVSQTCLNDDNNG